MDEFLAELRVRLGEWRARFVEWWRTERPRRFARRPRRAGPTRSYATVYATRHDDISSISGRIDTAADVDVVLIVPRAARWMRNPNVWPHIAAHVRRRGITLGVVSPRRDVRAYARENGLHSATTIPRLFRSSKYRIALGDREFFIPRVPWGGVTRGVAFLALLALIVGTACYTIPSAEVVIVPRSQEMTASMRVRLNPLVNEGDIERGIIPAQSVRRTITTVVSTTTTGDTEVGDVASTVELEFTNNTSSVATIPAGTVVETDNGTGFATDEVLEVPANSSATVGATALVRGTQGNVGAETLDISGSLPVGVTVINFEPATGGRNAIVAAVAAEDVDTVRGIASQVLRHVGRRAVEEAVQGGAVVFPETLSVAIFAERPLLQIGEPSEVFLMEYTAIVSALVLTEATANRFGELMLLDALPAGTALLPATTRGQVTGDPTVEGGSVSVQLVARGRIADLFDAGEVSDALVGESPGDASDRLRELLALETAPRITLKPEFIPWRWMPRRADRITILLSGGLSEDEENGAPSEAPATASGRST